MAPLQGAAAGCCGVLLEGAAVRVVCALWTGHIDACSFTQKSRKTVNALLEGALRFEWGMLVPLRGACCLRVLLEGAVRFGGGMLAPLQVPLHGAA
eukprot:s301_g19.t1